MAHSLLHKPNDELQSCHDGFLDPDVEIRLVCHEISSACGELKVQVFFGLLCLLLFLRLIILFVCSLISSFVADYISEHADHAEDYKVEVLVDVPTDDSFKFFFGNLVGLTKGLKLGDHPYTEVWEALLDNSDFVLFVRRESLLLP